MEGEIGAE